jgi:hypothetical protein
MRMIYSRRKAKLEAAGIQPTLKHLIFFRTALGRAVSLQPLIDSQDGSSSIQTSLSGLPSQYPGAAAAGAVDFEAVKTALAQQSQQQHQQLSLELREMRGSSGRLQTDLQRELRECNVRLDSVQQQQQHQQQGFASLTAQVQLLGRNNA